MDIIFPINEIFLKSLHMLNIRDEANFFEIYSLIYIYKLIWCTECYLYKCTYKILSANLNILRLK